MYRAQIHRIISRRSEPAINTSPPATESRVPTADAGVLLFIRRSSILFV